MSSTFKPGKEKIEAYEDAIKEAQRFVRFAQEALDTIRRDTLDYMGCAETAAAKRASMDLTRSLAKLRRARS